MSAVRSNETVQTPARNGVPFEDALILLLSKRLIFDAYTTPICLADQLDPGTIVGARVEIAGFGATRKFYHCETLLKAHVTIT